jgi:hypothetical protein
LHPLLLNNSFACCSSTVVSAALLRVMGGDVAELPLVATSQDVQGLVGLRIALLLNTKIPLVWSCG